MARKKLKEHLINCDWCKGCSICVKFCPKNVLELNTMEKQDWYFSVRAAC